MDFYEPRWLTFIEQFALTEAAYLLVRFSQRFEGLQWLGPPGTLKKDVHFTMAPRDGVKIRIQYAGS